MLISIKISLKFMHSSMTKTNCVTSGSFPWCVRLLNVALVQSVGENSLSYCETILDEEEYSLKT